MYEQMSKSLEENAKQFIRVGDDYYKINFEPDYKKVLHRKLEKRSKTTITDDYGRKIIDKIAKYEGFVMIPSHIDYEQVVFKYYNKYHELPHKPQKGKINTIIKYLTHIFSEQYLDFIIDYIQLLYLEPTQNLPIILLESQEKNTGKSTFGDFIRAIFEFNVMALSIKDLGSNFNSVWVEKLVLTVEETATNSDELMQMLKNLSVKNGSILANPKGKDQIEKAFFGKFIFTSNKEGKALPIENGDDRFHVRKVPTFDENNIEIDTKILEKMVKEIPAFLYYLQKRTLVHQRKGRMFFDKSVYFTGQLELYFQGNLGYTAKAIQNLLKDTFDLFPEEKTLSFSISDLLKELLPYAKHTDKIKVKIALEDEIGVKPNKKNRYTYFSLQQKEVQEGYYPTGPRPNNVYYTFERSKYDVEPLNSTIDDFQKVEQMAFF
jgi:hypothetical protein